MPLRVWVHYSRLGGVSCIRKAGGKDVRIAGAVLRGCFAWFIKLRVDAELDVVHGKLGVRGLEERGRKRERDAYGAEKWFRAARLPGRPGRRGLIITLGLRQSQTPRSLPRSFAGNWSPKAKRHTRRRPRLHHCS